MQFEAYLEIFYCFYSMVRNADCTYPIKKVNKENITLNAAQLQLPIKKKMKHIPITTAGEITLQIQGIALK
jgi:hypothetical protein